MIYTVTLNPALDHFVSLDSIQLGRVNRAESDRKVAGGKGINVSKVLKRHGHLSRAHGFIGGFTGRFIKDTLEMEQIETNFTEIKSDTRINIKIQSEDETEINGPSPQITEEDITRLIESLADVSDGDYIVLAGSVPATIDPTIYRTLTQAAKERNAHVFIDSSGEAFKEALLAEPTFIKPNHHELAELFNLESVTPEEAIPYVKQLLERGITYVLVSFAGDGALLGAGEEMYFANTPKGTLKNSVGAGDSVVAGFIAALSEEKSIEEAFQFAVASGSATAFSDGFCQREEVERYIDEIKIKNWGKGV